jgi:poly(beta-D-mannuronate) lyase
LPPNEELYVGKPHEGKPSPDLNTDIDEFPDLDISNIKRTIPCGKIKQLVEAINSAKSGDLILLADGEYPLSTDMIEESFKIKGKKIGGTDEAPIIEPIIVRAQHVGGVSLTGSAAFRFSDCKYFTWYGFNHLHRSIKDASITFEGGANTRFARCEVKLVDFVENDGKKKWRKKSHWLKMENCKRMKVDHCKFHQKSTVGHFIDVLFDDGKDNNVKDGPVIEYNHFLNQDLGDHPDNWPEDANGYGDAGGEAIKAGLANKCRTYYRVIFRYNLLEECNGDGEIISNKSCGNLYYHNVIVNNKKTDQSGSLTLRHGDSTAVLGNYFEGCGLRVWGADNLITNNHFTLNSVEDPDRWPLVINKGTRLEPDGERPESRSMREQVVDNDIIMNTFANGNGNADIIVSWGVGNGQSPTENRFRGNIITAQNGKLLKGVPASDNTIRDNIASITGNANEGNLTDAMAKIVDFKDLKLARASDGIYRLQSKDAIACTIFEGQDPPFSTITSGREGAIEDIYGASRIKSVHAGCAQHRTEESPEPPKKRITLEHVGTKATTDLGKSPEWDPPMRYPPKKN